MTDTAPGRPALEAPPETVSEADRLLGWAASLLRYSAPGGGMEPADWRDAARRWRETWIAHAEAAKPQPAPATARRLAADLYALADELDPDEGPAPQRSARSIAMKIRAAVRQAMTIPDGHPAPELAAALAEVDSAKLEEIADWFDADDQLKMRLYELNPGVFPETWEVRGTEMQADLRHWAKLLRNARERAALEADHG